MLRLLQRWGKKQTQGMSIELVDGEGQLPIAYRNTIANIMAEAEAQNGIFALDARTVSWYEDKGLVLPYPLPTPGEEARYEIDETLDLGEVVPMIARPYTPANADPAREVAKGRPPPRRSAIRKGGSGFSRRSARIGGLTSTSAATKRAACAVCTTAGSMT